MKKYLSVSLALLFAAAFVWADEAKEAENLKMDVDAKATLEWGFDRGSGNEKAKHGFNNKAEVKVKVPIIKKGKKTSKGDSDVSAEFEIGELELNLLNEAKDDGPGDPSNKRDFDGNIKKINAKFNFYGAYLTVYDKPSFKTNYASIWEPINKNDDYKESYKYEPGFDGFGTKLGYKNKELFGLDVGVKFGSITNMKGELTSTSKSIKKEAGKLDKEETKADKSSHHNYGIGFDAAMEPVKDLLALKLGVNAMLDKAMYYKVGAGAHTDGEAMGIGFGAEITSKPVKDLELKFGFDGGTAAKNKKGEKVAFAWDTSFTAKYKWVAGGIYVASTGTPFEGAIWKSNGSSYTPTADIGVFAKFETKGEKPEDANYLVKGLEAGAYLGVYNLLSTAPKAVRDKGQVYPMLMKLWAGYKQDVGPGMWIKPYAEVWGETNNKTYKDGTTDQKLYFGIMYKAGLAFQPAEKVELDAFWQQGKKDDKMYLPGQVITAAQHKGHKGMFKFAVTVKY